MTGAVPEGAAPEDPAREQQQRRGAGGADALLSAAPPLGDDGRLDAHADALLRLEDPRLEAAFWAHPAGGARHDVACNLLGIGMQALFIRVHASGGRGAPAGAPPPGPAPPPAPGGALASTAGAAHAAVFALMLGHLLLMLAAPRAYLRHRLGVQIGLRLVRQANNVLQTVFTAQNTAWWQSRLVGRGSDPHHALATSLLATPALFLLQALTNPCPFAAQLLLCGLSALIYLRGWLPICAAVWRHLARAGHAGQELCGRVALGLAAADAATWAAWGAPAGLVDGPAAAARAPGPAACLCLLQTLGLSLMLLLGLALPGVVAWRAEYQGKARFLHARGLRLRVRARGLAAADAWLRARGLAPRWEGAAAAPAAAAAAAAALLLWHVSAAVIAARSAPCRLVCADGGDGGEDGC
ncbi:MAG: hypothetical protein J3K34DRAFT_527280 [Monoraphidium minutum]|nr:MAG: hypothetical protein J3K34DRAFT_527280 [Monoraphidium minutum]